MIHEQKGTCFSSENVSEQKEGIYDKSFGHTANLQLRTQSRLGLCFVVFILTARKIQTKWKKVSKRHLFVQRKELFILNVSNNNGLGYPERRKTALCVFSERKNTMEFAERTSPLSGSLQQITSQEISNDDVNNMLLKLL